MRDALFCDRSEVFLYHLKKNRACDYHAITHMFSVIRVTSRLLSSRLRATQSCWNKQVHFQQ